MLVGSVRNHAHKSKPDKSMNANQSLVGLDHPSDFERDHVGMLVPHGMAAKAPEISGAVVPPRSSYRGRRQG